MLPALQNIPMNRLAKNFESNRGFVARHPVVIPLALVTLMAIGAVLLEFRRREFEQLVLELAPNGKNPINLCSLFNMWC